MAKRTSQKLAAILLFVLGVALIATGIYGMGRRNSEAGAKLLADMRTRALLDATGEGVVESYVEIAKKEANQKAKAEGIPMAQRRDMVAKAEEDARANNQASEIDYNSIDAGPIMASVERLEAALAAYHAEEAAEQRAYIERTREEQIATVEAEDAPASAADLSVEGDTAEVLDLQPVEQEADLSGFVATARMNELMAAADEEYLKVGEALKGIYPVLNDDALATLKDTVKALIYRSGDDYTKMFDRFSASGGADALEGNIWAARVIRYGDDLIALGIGLTLLALSIWFYHGLVKAMGLPRLIIGLFFVLLCVVSVIYDLSLTDLLSNTLVRLGMNGVLVLAMVPGIQCGVSLNLGLPIGIVAGLLGGLLCIELGYSGLWGFVFALTVGILLSAVFGYLYALLLNRLKGNEMAVTTYVGFSIISVMCIAWLTLPFKSLELRWPLGTGLRNTLSMGSSFRHILDDFWAFNIGGFTIPTGLLLFLLLCCALVWLFNRSKTGVAMQAVGNNPRFAEATGISIDKMRIIGTTLSTILGAVGILVYSQSFGFMQLYTAPRQMGFIAASAILIGGATTTRAKISHVLIGTLLFQGVLALGMPVANALVPRSTLAETMRILISYGIILYALTKSGGASRA